MNATLPSCSQCQQPFWPSIGQNSPYCPECAKTEASASAQQGRKTILPQPHPLSGNTVSVRPRELPGSPLPAKPEDNSAFEAVRGKRSPQIMFTCPSCMTMLALKQDFQVSGNALPCPYCATAILPPQIFVPKETVAKRASNVWKIGEQKDRNKIYRPPRDNANVVFLKAKS